MDPSPFKNLSHPRIGPLIETPKYLDTKDPCPVFDGLLWHLYGSGGISAIERCHILHAISPTLKGPWQVTHKAELQGIVGGGLAAPSVIHENGIFHMFIQTHYAELGSTIEHLVSEDGQYFKYKNTALVSIPDSQEAGIYDPHTTIIDGQKYLSYSGFPTVGRPDIYLAKSETNTWDGPWHRIGKILSHEETSHHNQLNQPDYEWGLEGSQLIQLNSGLILMNAVCFLPKGERGERQRVFFSVAKKPEGPYFTIGPILNPLNNEWESGENGHAAGVIVENTLNLFYQARARSHGKNHWRYGLVRYDVTTIIEIAEKILSVIQ